MMTSPSLAQAAGYTFARDPTTDLFLANAMRVAADTIPDDNSAYDMSLKVEPRRARQ